MPQKRFVAILTVGALVALVAGCAGPRASSLASEPGAASELSGTWVGSFVWVGAVHYTDEGTCILRVTENGTFT